MKTYHFAILGAGHIAGKMAQAIRGLIDLHKDGRICLYAVASRSKEKAEAFTKKWGFEKAYGSYEDLARDAQVDLIYIATPHSHHFEHVKLCIWHGKACLVEKAFTANSIQAEELISFAHENKVFLTEAIWTRYMPARYIVKDILDSGVLGELISMEAEFSMNLADKERLYNPALAGGSLLDLGIYPLTFASMYFGNDIVEITTSCEKYKTGVDATDEICYLYRDGKKAKLRTSMVSDTVNEGRIYGTGGSLYVATLNNFTRICRLDLEGKVLEEYPIPEQINGYEYEVLSCMDAMDIGKLECEEMPHKETIELMRQMDELRHRWGVIYPFENNSSLC